MINLKFEIFSAVFTEHLLDIIIICLSYLEKFLLLLSTLVIQKQLQNAGETLHMYLGEVSLSNDNNWLKMMRMLIMKE